MSDKLEEYRGTKIIVRFEGMKCIHSRHCVLEEPAAFEANAEGPWIHPEAASPEAIVAVAHNCPSGAITYERLDGGAQESVPAVNTVQVRENGPVSLHADLHIDGKLASFRSALCRCGASKNKPYCDASHVAAGFKASGEPATQSSEPLTRRDGLVNVVPLKDGPLDATGNVEICSGTGRTILRTQQTYLCRCGGSANKPFCDGTHKTIGFTT